MILVVLVFISAVSFLYYGLQLLWQPRLAEEFARYRIPGARKLVGVLEILGAAGVLVGLGVPLLGAAAAAGLTTLMMMGLALRIRLHDTLRQMLPAALLAAVNALLVVAFLRS